MRAAWFPVQRTSSAMNIVHMFWWLSLGSRVVWDIVSSASIYWNIGLSIHRNIELPIYRNFRTSIYRNIITWKYRNIRTWKKVLRSKSYYITYYVAVGSGLWRSDSKQNRPHFLPSETAFPASAYEHLSHSQPTTIKNKNAPREINVVCLEEYIFVYKCLTITPLIYFATEQYICWTF